MNHELEDVLLAAARAVPPSTYDFDGISQRGKVRRRRRTITIAGVAATVLAIAVAIPLTLSGGNGSLPIGTPTASPTSPQQRMMINGGGMIYEAPGKLASNSQSQSPDQFGVLWDRGELMADGTLRKPPNSTSTIPDPTWVFAPDGGFAVHDLIGELCSATTQELLILMDTVGKEYFRADIHKGCGSSVVAVDSKNAYLNRERVFYALDLATKKERPLFSARDATVWGLEGSTLFAVENQLDGTCGQLCNEHIKISTYDLATGIATEHFVAWKGAVTGGETIDGRLSPDGKRLAISYVSKETDGVSLNNSLVIVDLTKDVVLQEYNFAAKRPTGIAGMAWIGNTTLKVAHYPIPQQGLHKLMDIIEYIEFGA